MDRYLHHRASRYIGADHGAGHWTARRLPEDGLPRRERVLLKYEMPLAELIVDFYDQLKTRTQGYASSTITSPRLRPSDLVKLDVLVNGQPVDALSLIIAPRRGLLPGPGTGGKAARA